MKAVFADTFYWIALTDPDDGYSQVALQFDEFFSEGTVYTTEEVLTEVLAFFRHGSMAQKPPGGNCPADCR